MKRAISAAFHPQADHLVEAELYHVRPLGPAVIGSEIEEARWVTPADAVHILLAPLIRDHVLPLALSLRGLE